MTPNEFAIGVAVGFAWNGFQEASRGMVAAVAASSDDNPDPLPLFAAYNRVSESLRVLRDAVDDLTDDVGKIVFDGMQEILLEAIAEEAKR